MATFAEYILNEQDFVKKIDAVTYLKKKQNIYFNTPVILKAEIARIYMEYMKLDLDKNLVLTAMLLCNCKKIDNAQKIGKLETFAKDGASYLESLGFSKRFCKICEEVNRYSGSEQREPESDVLEIVDQFVGLILNRVEREAFTTEEAIIVLKERNMKASDNRYMDSFIQFIEEMEKICIREVIEVPIIKKLVNLHNKEANVKTFIAILANKYSKKIDNALIKKGKMQAKELFEEDDTITEYELLQKRNFRSLFSNEIANRVINHESKYKVEE